MADISDEYGRCPHCGAKCATRERRPNGNDECENGHVYPSSAAVDGDGKVSVVVEPGRWETVCRPDQLWMHHRMALKDCRRLSGLNDALTNLCAGHEQAIDTLAAACRAILAGWGHQDGVSKAVELARLAIDHLEATGRAGIGRVK